ncbi:MAG: hypothetical protein Salg2KO_16240 [Salibacteraceae bacterium]
MKRITSLLFCLVSTTVFSQTTILLEDFEDSNLTYTTNFPDDLNDIGASDYFGRIDETSGLPTGVSYLNPQGTGFYGVQDFDGTDSGDIETIQLDWTDIDIVGFTDLNLSWFIAEDDANDLNEDWDQTSSVRLEVQINKGGYVNIFTVESSSDSSLNTEPREDTDLDGIGDGTTITDSFTQFSATITDGSILDIRLTIEDLDTGDEDIAFDNLLLTGEAGDSTSPNLVSVDPADDTTDIAIEEILTATFDEPVQWASGGSIIIQDLTDNTVLGTLTEASGAVSFSDDTMVIDPMPPFSEGHEYELQIPDSALEDLAGNSFVGIASLGWTFTVVRPQDANEPPDFPGIGLGPIFALNEGENTFSGRLTTPTDGQDRFQIALDEGQIITNIIASITTNDAPQGFFSFNGSEVLAFPGGTLSTSPFFMTSGDYPIIVATDFAVGNDWTVTITVTEESDPPQDNEPPMLECPVDIIVDNDSGECGAIVEFTPTATDDSGSVTVSADFITGGVFPVGTTLVTVTATDPSDNTATCTFNITVNDNELPVVLCKDASLQLNSEGEAFVGPEDIADSISDNCAIETVIVSPLSFNESNLGDNKVTLEVSDVNGNTSICSVNVNVMPFEDNSLAITSFTLINADTDEDLFELIDGMQIDNRKLPTLNLDIRANTNDNVESVRLSITSAGGGFSNSRTESLLPFAFFQDLPIGDYMGTTFPFNDFFTISATPHSEDNLGGVEGNISTLTFEIADYCQEATDRSFVDTFPADCEGLGGRAVLETTLEISESDAPFWEFNPELGNYSRILEAGTYSVSIGEEPGCTRVIEFTIERCVSELLTVTGFTLIDADNDVPLFDLTEGQQIDINSLPTTNLDIRANTTNDVESVRISISGELTNERTESLPPYALFQDLPIGDYTGEEFVIGEYAVMAIPYAGNSLAGDMGTPLTLNFELVDGDPACITLMADVEVMHPSTCNGNDSRVTIIPSGGTAPYGVAWFSFSSEDETVEGLSAGTYAIDVYDANRCRIRVFAEIIDPELPEVSLDPFADVLSTDSPFELVGGIPLGGDYSGDGIADGMFDPSIGPGTYSITYTFTEGRTGCTNTATQEIVVKAENFNDIVAFWLVNADNEEDLFPITEGMQIDVSTLPTQNLDIRAETGAETESVGFELSGAQSIMRGESVPPYALFQDLPIGDYIGHEFDLGEYSLSGTPYSQNNLQGDAGETSTINFEFIDSTPTLSVIGFTLINAENEEELFELTEGMEISINDIPSLFLDIRANTTDDVESVRLELSGQQSTARTESLEPYALFQDLPIGDYKGNNFEFGEYTVTAVPYSGNNLMGEMGTPQSITLEIVDNPELNTLTISPNQATTLARASFKRPTEVTQILIFDFSGRMIESYNPQYIKSGDDYILDVNFYPQGSYIVKMVDNKGVPYQKQMIVK